jgi:hypothetical protein
VSVSPRLATDVPPMRITFRVLDGTEWVSIEVSARHVVDRAVLPEDRTGKHPPAHLPRHRIAIFRISRPPATG